MVLATSGIDLTMMYMITDGFLAANMTPQMDGSDNGTPGSEVAEGILQYPGKYYLADKDVRKLKKGTVV